MKLSHWTKRSSSFLLSGPAIYGLSILMPLSIMGALGQLQSTVGIVLTILLTVGGVMLARWFNNRSSYRALSRTIKTEYDATEFILRRAFNTKHIRFQRQLEEETKTHLFEFSGNGLTLTMTPYDLVNGVRLGRDAVSQKVLVDSLGVLLTIDGVGQANRAYAEKLATIIDEAVEKKPSASS